MKYAIIQTDSRRRVSLAKFDSVKSGQYYVARELEDGVIILELADMVKLQNLPEDVKKSLV